MSRNELLLERRMTPLTNIGELDADGYIWLNAGAYNIYNESGVYYDGQTIDPLFEQNSVLQRRIAKAVVRAELGHPERLPGMSDAMYESRMMNIKEDRFCGHIRAAKLVSNSDSRVKITKINITPFGHYKSTLMDAIKTKDANCFFSVRSLSNRQRINGVLVKFVYEIITWDFVNEGGIGIANKFDTNMDLESYSSYDIARMTRENELMNIDLDDTASVKYILKHYEDFKGSTVLDAESLATERTVYSILQQAVRANSADAIFNWK